MRAKLLFPFGLQPLRLFNGFINAADVHECIFAKVVVLAVAQLFEATDRFGDRRHLARHDADPCRRSDRVAIYFVASFATCSRIGRQVFCSFCTKAVTSAGVR